MVSFVKVCPNWAGPMVCLFLLYFLSILTSPLGTFIQNKWLVAMRVYISTFLCHHRCSFQPKRGHMASRQKNKFAKLLSDPKTARLGYSGLYLGLLAVVAAAAAATIKVKQNLNFCFYYFLRVLALSASGAAEMGKAKFFSAFQPLPLNGSLERSKKVEIDTPGNNYWAKLLFYLEV